MVNFQVPNRGNARLLPLGKEPARTVLLPQTFAVTLHVSNESKPLTSDNYYFTLTLMIRSFKHRGLKRLYERGDRSGMRPDLLETVERILTVLDSASSPQDLDLPRYRLHPLKGGMKGFWSVTVRANWRIIFHFEGNDAFDVQLIDYH